MRNSRKIIYSIAVILLCATLSACSGGSKQNGKKSVTVSILPLGYLAERIAGDRFDVAVMVPAGSSPETYEPTIQQMKTTSDSEIYFAVGNIEFENSFADRLKQSAPNVEFVDLSDYVSLIEGSCGHDHAGAHHHGKDPHTWMSPREMLKMSAAICDKLSAADPESAGYYKNNLDSLTQDINLLDSYIASKLDTLDTRTVIINHPALGYYTRDYGLTQIAIEEEGKEPSTRHLKEVVDTARAEGIKTVLYQSQFGAWSVEAVAREIGGHSTPVDPLAGDWLSNMYKITDIISDAGSRR